MPGFVINGTGGDKGVEEGAFGRAEARRKYRWLFRLIGNANGAGGSSGNITKSFLYLLSARRPSWTHQPIDQHHNQERIGHIGKTQWDDIELKWYDMETPIDCCEEIYKWMETTTYNIETASPQHPTVYKQTCALDILDHAGDPTESWDIYNAWPYKVDPDTLDYGGNELLMITCTLRYDRAVKTM